jgi:hypothetical protein
MRISRPSAAGSKSRRQQQTGEEVEESEKEKQLLRQAVGEAAAVRESVPERSTGWDIGANGAVLGFGAGLEAAAASLGFLRGGDVEVVAEAGAEGKCKDEAPVVGRRRRRRSAMVRRRGGFAAAAAGGSSMVRDLLRVRNFSGKGGRGEELETSGRETRGQVIMRVPLCQHMEGGLGLTLLDWIRENGRACWVGLGPC